MKAFADLTPEEIDSLTARLQTVAALQGEFWDALGAFERELAETLGVETFGLCSSDELGLETFDQETYDYLVEHADEIVEHETEGA